MNGTSVTNGTGTPAAPVLVTVDRPRRPGRVPRASAVVRAGGFVRAPSGPERDATVLAGFAALLFRYTGQARVTVDRPAGTGDGRRTGRTEIELRANEALSGPARRGAAPAPATADEPPATVAVWFGDADGPDGPDGTGSTDGGPYELSLHSTDGTGGSVAFALHYDPDLFDASSAARMLDHLTVLLADAAEHPDRPVSRLRLLTRAEQQRMLVDWNRTGTDLPHGVCLHEAFERHAERAPDAVAVRHRGRDLTYRQVDSEANRLAHHLRSLGVGPDVRVGLCLDRSPALLVAMLGILKAGGAYVPLDPAYPAQRIATMIDGTACAVMVSREELASVLPAEAVASRPLVLLDRDAAALADHPADAPAGLTEPDDLCYVIHTSGSTGAPKPIALRHRGVMNNLADMNRRFDVGPGDATLSLSSPSFDMSVYEYLGMATAGGTVVVPEPDRAADPAHWAELVGDEGVTVWNSAPALLGLLLDECEQNRAGTRFDRLRLVMLGGDWAPVTLPGRIRSVAPDARVIVLGGVTEASIHSTIQDATDVDVRRPSVPYGRPMANQRVYILDEAGEPVPPGVAGEIHIAGIGLARGYLDQPERTAERFREWSYGDIVRDRVYRTGDLARFDASGLIELLGRIDFQAKINGLRIEPGEIEAVLRGHPAVDRAAVVARDGRLVAYAVPVAGERIDDDRIAELRETAAARLPEFMVPAVIVTLDALPLTPNGKVDRAGLPAVDVPGTRYREPSTPPERDVAAVFADVLGLERVGADDDFVALGGDSVRSIQVVTRLRARGRVTTTGEVFRHRTAAALAPHLTAVGTVTALPSGPLVAADEVQEARWRRRHPGFREAWPLTPMQSGMLFESLLNETGRDTYQMQTVYRLAGAVDAGRLRRACAALLERHPVLRVGFTPAASDELVGIVVDGVELPWAERDLTHLDGPEQDAELRRLLDSDRGVRFDLETPPLLRATLVRRGPERSDLVLSSHHALIDGWSEQVIGRELQLLYDDPDGAARAGEAPGFRDFLAWLSTRDTARSGRAWADELRGVDEGTLVAPAADAHAQAEAVSEVVLPATVLGSRAAARACGELGVTASTLVQVAWGALLGALTGRDDVVFGAAVSGRPADLDDVESAVGLFINTVPVRVRTGTGSTVADVLVDLQQRQTALADHHHHGLADLHRACGVAALFDSLVVVQSYPPGTGEPGDDGFAVTGIESVGGVNYPLALLVEPERTVLQYHRNRFAPGEAEAIAQRFVRVLEQVVAAPTRPIGSLDVLLPAERSRYAAPHRVAGPSAPEAVAPLVERYAAVTPDAPAVVFGGTCLTYAELNVRANRLAHDLIGRGIGPGSTVGIVLPPSTQLTIAMLGVLKTGGAHVVVDPADPHRDEILAATGTVRDLRWLDVETTTSSTSLDPTDRDRGSTLHPLGVACIRFPDRDTDRPLGTAVGHRALAEDLLRYAAATGVGPGSRIMCAAAGDDRTAFGILAGLCRGAVVELVREADGLGGPDTAADVLHTAAPRVAAGLCGDAPAGTFGTVVLSDDGPGGAPVAGALVDRIRSAMPGTEVITTGGTSAAPHSLAGRAGPDAGPHGLPVGHPVGNQRAYVLDPALRPLPDGAVGELYLAGSIAQGFHGQPGATAERFVADPWGPPGARMHRAGVLARRDGAGRLDVLGRSADRLSVGGRRFWPHEVETVLAGHPDVGVATVSGEDERVLARVAPRSPACGADEAGIRAYAARHLPSHMVPDVVRVESGAAPASEVARTVPEPLPAPVGDPDGPRDEREAALCELFADVLGLERVGADENVFDLGVNSLLAGRLVSRIRRTLGVKVPIRTLFQKLTIAGIAAELPTTGNAPARPALRRTT